MQMQMQIKIEESESRTNSSKRETKKRFFSEEEDKKLFFLVSKFGRTNWQEIANLLGNGFNSRQCRERYANYLDPRWSHEPFKIEEDKLLEEMVHTYGNAWSRISHSFPDRSEVSLKNRWTLIRRRQAKAIRLNHHNQIEQEQNKQIIEATRVNEFSVEQNQDDFFDFGFDSDLNFENVFDEQFGTFNIFEE